MKVIIEIPEEDYIKINSGEKRIELSCNIAYEIANGIPIPDNATNGEVIRAIFKPNNVKRTDDDVIMEEYQFDTDWWNAPFTKII